MPDLDDLFEDAFDVVKKKIRTHRKKRKKARKLKVAREKEHMSNQKHRGNSYTDDEEWQRNGADVGVTSGNRRLTVTTRQEELHDEEGPDNEGRSPSPLIRLKHMRRKLDGSYLHDVRLRRQIDKADEYASGIKKLARRAGGSYSRARLDALVRETQHWNQSLRSLASRVDAFHQDSLLQRDLESVPRDIQRLETQLKATDADHLRNSIERALDNRRHQLASLQKLADTMHWAEFKIETTLSVLGALYSQAHVSQSKGKVADYGRLLEEIEEEARSLDDYVTSLAEVKEI